MIVSKSRIIIILPNQCTILMFYLVVYNQPGFNDNIGQHPIILYHTLGNIVAGNCCWLQCFLVYDSNVSVLRVSGNCFPGIENISIPGNMFPRTSKGRQICDVA